jgi:hypothetical protein
LSQAEADIATWTKAGYVEKINRPRGQYRLSKRGVIYAENHRTSLPLLQVEVLAAFWNNIEGQEVIIVRVQAPRSGVKAALRRLADLHLATFNRAERTYALTASGLELARDPRVRARRQYQKRHRQADAALGRHTCGPE